MVWTTNANRDAHGHLGHQQVWTSVMPAGTVHLYFAHRGITLGGHNIQDTNNFFYKHFLLPSKSGKTVQQKAENRVDKRQGPKQLHLKVASGQAAGKAWAQPTVGFAAQFVANLANGPFRAGLGLNDATWSALRAPMLQELQTLAPNATDAARNGAVRKVIGVALQGNAKPYLDAFKNADDASNRAGLGWADKYGAILTPANTAIVLSDGAAANWAAPGIVPISSQAAAQSFYNALLARANAAAALPAEVAATVNFGQACVMSGTKNNPNPVAWTTASTMKIRARAISPLLYDVYHYDP